AGTLAMLREVLAPLVVGADPFDVEWIARRMERAAFGNSFARAAVEMALLDLQGKTLGVPVYKLLGGRNTTADSIRLKFVVGAVEAEVAAQRARRMVDAGWTAIKVKVGRHEHPRVDIERLRAVREAIGPSVFLSVDANGGYTVEQAVWAALHMEPLGVALFEQPTRRGDHQAMAEVRQRSGIPIMADESVFTPLDALEVIRHRAADVLSLYPGKRGYHTITVAMVPTVHPISEGVLMRDPYDGIILGTGHNALVLQAYLCRAGLRVLSLDRADVPGGGLTTVENSRLPGFFHNTHSFFHRALTVMPWYRDLELQRHGARYVEPELNVVLILPDGRALEWWTDLDRTVASFAEFSAKDAAALRRWVDEFRPIVENV